MQARIGIPARMVMALLVTAIAWPTLAFADAMSREKLYDVPQSPQTIHERLPELIGLALERDDMQTRLQALDAVAAFELKMLGDAVVGILKQDDRPIIRAEAIAAAAAIGRDDAATIIRPWLTELPTASPEQRDVVLAADRAMARFDDVDAVSIWRDRAMNAESPMALRISAADAIGRVAGRGEAAGDVVEAMHDLATDRRGNLALRLAAARSYATIVDADAAAPTALYEQPGRSDRLVALTMLVGRDAATARSLRQRAARDDNPAVQRLALQQLLDEDADEGLPLSLLEAVIDSPDPVVRRLAYEGLAMRHQPEAARLLFNHLGDGHPANREAARQSLEALAAVDTLEASIRGGIERGFGAAWPDRSGERWGELEQLSILAGKLDHEPVAGVLVEVAYDHPRIEPSVAAVEALAGIDVAETHGPMVALFERQIEQVEASTQAVADLPGDADRATRDRAMAVSGDARELARVVAVALGVWTESDADAVLRSVIPKTHILGADARAAAIWALGHIHAGQSDGGLTRALLGRLNDYKGLEPEMDNVRLQAAIAVGRFGDRGAVNNLRQRYEAVDESLEIRVACRWAIEQITGEAPPEIEVQPHVARDAFITPIDRR